MPAPHPEALRQRVVDAYLGRDNSETYKSIAWRFGVGLASVSRWLRAFRETGSVAPKPMGGDRRKAELLEEASDLIEVIVRDDPSWTTSELSEKVGMSLGLNLSRKAIGLLLHTLGFSFKRAVFRAPASSRPDVVRSRERYIEQQPEMNAHRLVFVDETGFIVDMNRLYGWAPVGEQAIVSGMTKGKRLSVIGAMSTTGPRGMMSFEGTLNTDVMLKYIHTVMGPNLRKGDIVVMDGLSVHRSARVAEALQEYGASALILPPYSPELNPIEHLWSTLKARVRATGATTWSRLVTLVDQVWKELNATFYPNWVKACGYTVN